MDHDVAAIVRPETAQFHRFLRQGVLRLQRCSGCGYTRAPGRPFCPQCLSEVAEWRELPGTGRVEASVWYYEDAYDGRYDTGWAWRDIPYNVGLVALDGGPVLLSNVVGTNRDALAAGSRVRPVFIPISEIYAVLRFALVNPKDETGRASPVAEPK